MARLLGVSLSGYYQWRQRQPSQLSQLRMAKKQRTTQSDPIHRVVGNQLDRCFRTEAPNQVWVSDLTYLKVVGQWRYLVIFLDLFSRKVVGWDLSDSLEASGTVRALQ